MPSNAAIPVEALLKLSLDKAGAQQIQDFLDKQESSFSRIGRYADNISSSLEGITRGALGLAGIAGIGAVVQNFLQTSQAGGLVGLAAGHVTGGTGVSTGYGQALLGVQAKTGVNATSVGEGLVQAIQAVGGTPSPQQAAILGGLLAGYGQTVGMSPSQVAQVVTPILQASNKPLTSGSLLASMAGLSQGLSAFPGGQAGPMLGLLSQLGVAQALGVGPAGGFTPNMHGLTAAVNAAAQTNSIFRNPGVAGGAISGVSGGLQNAYGNPSMEAFLQRAGINYWQQRAGFTPQNVQAIMGEATSLYGTGVTRDLALRSMFGLQGADLLEQFGPGSRGAAILHRDMQLNVHPNQSQLQNQIANAQLAHTPSALLSQLSGKILKFLETPGGAIAGIGGAWAIKKAIGASLRGLRGLGGSAAGGTAADAGSSVAGDLFTPAAGSSSTGGLFGAGSDAAGGSTWGDILSGAGSKLLGVGAGAILGSLAFPDNAGGGSDTLTSKSAEQAAVQYVIRMALRKFGPAAIRSPAARQWMTTQLEAGPLGPLGPQIWGTMPGGLTGGQRMALTGMAPRLLDQVLGAGGGVASHVGGAIAGVGSFGHTASGKDPMDVFGQGATDLEKAAQALLQIAQRGAGGSGFAAYQLGTPALQGIGATAPGMEFAALAGGGSNSVAFASFTGGAVGATSSSSGGGTPVSTTTGGSSGGVGPGVGSAAGGQSCTLTWYDPALGGTNSGSGRPQPNGPTASTVPYSPTAYTCAAPSNYAFGTIIAFSYGGKTCSCEVTDRGGAITGSHFDLARAPATYLGIIGPGVVTGTFKVIKTGNGTAVPESLKASGGNSGGLAGAGGSSGGSSGGSGGGPGGGPGGSGGGPGGSPGAHVASAGGGPPVIQHHHHHHHVYVDGKEIRAHRIITGHAR